VLSRHIKTTKAEVHVHCHRRNRPQQKSFFQYKESMKATKRRKR